MKSLLSLMMRGCLASIAVLSLSIPAQAITAADVTFNGNASPGINGRFQLVPAALGQAGSVFLTKKRKVNLGFITSFQFRISNPGGIEGADGLAFVIQNDGNTALGAAGGGIGYHGIPRSIAVEFDTFQNGFGGVSDPNNNHVSIHTRGILPNSVDEAFSLGSNTFIPNLSDGSVHFVQIAWFAGIMTVRIDGSTVLKKAVSLVPVLDAQGKTYFGFTAATGAGFELHEVNHWCLSTF